MSGQKRVVTTEVEFCDDCPFFENDPHVYRHCGKLGKKLHVNLQCLSPIPEDCPYPKLEE